MITNPGRKLRADAKLEQLDAAQRELLHFWFEENFSYYEVVRLVQEKFGLSVGKSTVAAYWKRHIMPERQQDDTEDVAALAALPAGDFNAAILRRAWALAWAALAQSHPDIDRAAKLLAIVQKAEQHALALKKLALEERRVALREKLADRQSRATAAKKLSEAGPEPLPAEPVTCEQCPTAVASREAQNLPRYAGYSGAIRAHVETEIRPGRSAEEAGRDESAEVAAKAPSGEGLSKETEDTSNFSGQDGNGIELRTSTVEQLTSKERKNDAPAQASAVDAWLEATSHQQPCDEASVEEELTRIERSLEEIGEGEEGAAQLAAVANAAHALMVRYMDQQGLSIPQLPHTAVNSSAPHLP